jgi:hypothetical protein
LSELKSSPPTEQRPHTHKYGGRANVVNLWFLPPRWLAACSLNFGSHPLNMILQLGAAPLKLVMWWLHYRPYWPASCTTVHTNNNNNNNNNDRLLMADVFRGDFAVF